MPYARIYGCRHAFKNYSAFVNPGDTPVNTIFHARGFEPHCRGATFSGCGQINPLKNDPLLESIGIGTRILLNGAEGFVLGTGTRSTRERPNLSGFADMHQMSPEYMGGFATSAGPECICSWACAHRRDQRHHPGGDCQAGQRYCAAGQRYKHQNGHRPGQLWPRLAGRGPGGGVRSERCQGCTRCRVEKACPMKAVSFDLGEARAHRDESDVLPLRPVRQRMPHRSLPLPPGRHPPGPPDRPSRWSCASRISSGRCNWRRI